MRNLEQELKLQLDKREYEILAKVANKQPQLQTNYYFWSEHLSQEVMVRVREKEGKYLLGYKARLQQRNGVCVCDERECEIDASFAKNMIARGITPRELSQILRVETEDVLRYAGKMETYRTKFTLEEWTLELDKSLYFDRCDYELECESAYVQQLEKLKNYLSYNYGIVMKFASPKSQRFFEAKQSK